MTTSLCSPDFLLENLALLPNPGHLHLGGPRRRLNHKGIHRTGEATGGLEAFNKGLGRPRPGELSPQPRFGSGRRPTGPRGPTTYPWPRFPHPRRAQVGGRAGTPRRHHRRLAPETPARTTPRDHAGGGDAVTCRGQCRSPPAPLSWQPRQPHEGRQPRA